MCVVGQKHNSMKSKLAGILFCTAAGFAAGAADLLRSQTPAATNSVQFLRSTPTNLVFQVRWPDGSLTNVVARGFVYTATNVLFESVRSDGTLTNFVVGGAPPRPNLPSAHERVIAAPRYQPVGDYWLPGEFQQLLDKRKEERRQKAQ